MQKLKYIIEDSTIAEVLGLQNYTSKESAILELVKNSYDAGAFNVQLNFKQEEEYTSLYIFDDGTGMNENDLKTKWMHVGKSYRSYTFRDIKNNTRVYSGSKGIGRFALARLGKAAEIYTKTVIDKDVHWYTDWDTIKYDYEKMGLNHGTFIKVYRLRDKWNIAQIKKLQNYLSRTCNTNLMKIIINFEDKSYMVGKFFMNEKIGLNYTSKIDFSYSSSSQSMVVNVVMDEFKPIAKEICGTPISGFHKTLDVYDYLYSKYSKEYDSLYFKKMLLELGDFSGELYFALNASSTDTERFLYKSRTYELKNTDVILYRNSFSISGYDGTKDWLALNARSRRSPAAATHDTGSWRVRSNQLTGSILIDKKKNPELKDLSNRQGLDENEYFDLFKLIIDKTIAEFERYRQSIIRKIHSYNESKVTKEIKTKAIDHLLRTKQNSITFQGEELDKLKTEINSLKTKTIALKNEGKETEEKLKYEVQILNVLATLGLKSTSIAHQIHNKKNFLYSYYDDIVNRLKVTGIWEQIIRTTDEDHIYNNVPAMLSTINEISTWMIKYMETALEEVSKDKFIAKKMSLQEILLEIKNVWEADYSWITIDIDDVEDMEMLLSWDILHVIFDNLILNSVQQNERFDSIHIHISAASSGQKILFSYRDDGVGLPKQYQDDPFKILEVHETSRYKGHGLGMWIIHNTILTCDGDITAIISNRGFNIKFNIKYVGIEDE